MLVDEPMAQKAFGRRCESRHCWLLCRRPGTKRLVFGVEAGAIILYQNPLDSASTNGAWFASLMSNLELKQAVPNSPFITCYLFQTFVDIRHEFKGHCIRLLGLWRSVFACVFSNNASPCTSCSGYGSLSLSV